MRYHGGKSKIATSIASVILNTIQKERELVSLFCGTCSVEAKLAPHFEHAVCI
jgi:site-specific DNA-adenine methylase